MGRREIKKQTPILGQQAYDGLKFVALVLLPALGALYFGLAEVWNLPYTEQVIGTITVVDTFLGVFLRYDNQRYNSSEANYLDGVLVVNEEDPDKDTYQWQLAKDPEELAKQNVVKIQVQKQS